MRESDLLTHIANAGVKGTPGVGGATVVVGPGDDCAVVRSARGETLLLTVDHLIEGRHFHGPVLRTGSAGEPGGTAIDLIARKAMARSVSDVAAMGGTPTWALATAAFPHGFDDAAARELFDALQRWAQHWGCPLVGGDTATLAPVGGQQARGAIGTGGASATGPSERMALVLTTTVIGAAHAARGPVLRSGARAGDGVWVTGRIGGSLASGRHLTFEPRLREAAWLCDFLGAELHAMIDVSDGLGRDAGRVARASGVRIEIDAHGVPTHEGCTNARRACADGEDYELLFTLSAEGETRLAGAGPGGGGSGRAERGSALCPETGVSITRIGRVLAPQGAGDAACVLIDAGQAIDARTLGWDHSG